MRKIKLVSILILICLLLTQSVYGDDGKEFDWCNDLFAAFDKWEKKYVDPSIPCPLIVEGMKVKIEKIRCAGYVPEDYMGKNATEEYLKSLAKNAPDMKYLMVLVNEDADTLLSPDCKSDKTPESLIELYKTTEFLPEFHEPIK